MDYWNIDVDFFENKKVLLILGEFGVKGVYVLLLILNEIYRTCGYYKKWDADDCLLASVKTGTAGGCSPELIAEVVQGCIKRSLFDKRVFDAFGVLTSAEIQRRFLRIVGNSRESIPMIEEYFLLDPSSRKDVTRATLGKIAFFSIASKESAENLKVEAQNLKVLDKEQNRKEKNTTTMMTARVRAREAPEPVEDPELARVMNYFLDKVDPMPSPLCRDELIAYTRQFGADIVLRAFYRARDQVGSQIKWSYVRVILQDYARSGVRTLDDVFRLEQAFDERKKQSAAQRGGRSGGRGQKTPARDPLLDMIERGEFEE